MSNAGKLEGRPFRRRRHVALVLLVIAVSLLAALIPARVNAQDSGGGSNKSTPEYTKWDDLSGKTVGMVTGGNLRNRAPREVPQRWRRCVLFLDVRPHRCAAGKKRSMHS